MKRSKGIAAIAFVAVLALGMCLFAVGCSSSSSSSSGSSGSASEASSEAASETASSASAETAAAEDATLGIAYQYGLSYAPVVIAMEKGLIEENYNEATGANVTIEWNQMSSGADINTGITSGSIQVGFMGIGPAVTGIMSGLDYKIFANISGQEHGMMTNDPDITSIGDLIGSDKQIALVNIGSIQHLLLAKALADNGYDAHALDSNIVAMKHPDGMTALQSGNVACHLTSSPYIFKERDDDTLHELTEVTEAWTKDDSFIVGVASQTLHDNTALYQAVCDAIAEGQAFINDNPEEAAEILCELDGNTAEEELELLAKGSYTSKTSNLFEMATFMADNAFIDSAPESYEALVYDNVNGN